VRGGKGRDKKKIDYLTIKGDPPKGCQPHKGYSGGGKKLGMGKVRGESKR